MSDQPQNQASQPDHALPTIKAAPGASDGCCRLAKLRTPAMIAMTLLAISGAAYFAGRSAGERDRPEATNWTFPPINATASATSEKFSIATGFVAEDSEGFFVLDHNSGLLQCNVIYPRLGRFMAQFTGNVAETLGTGGKGGQYVMVTGQADFTRASNRPVGSCILYVLDTATGNYACYGIPFDRVAQNANRPQQGTFVLIHQGTANPLIDRDVLR